MTARILACAFGLIAANYSYQALGSHDWALAGERSIFQGMALLALWLSLLLAPEARRR
jgi:hypothetical protein